MTNKSEKSHKFGVICRICLKGDGPMFSIFTTSDTANDNQPILADRITSISQIQMSPDDGLPVSICQSCRQQVNKFYDFRLLVEISDRALRSYLDCTQGNQKISSRPVEDANDLDYQEFLIENNADNPKDLFAVNAVLLPSGSETESQVWHIRSVEEGGEETKQEPKITKKKIKVAPKQNNVTKIADSGKNDVSGVKVSFPRTVQPVAIIKNVQDKKPLIFTTTTNNENGQITSNDNEKMTCVTIIDDIDNEDEDDPSLPPNKYSCQLCLKPFKTLKTLKTHVKDHFLSDKDKIQICTIESKKVRLTRKYESSNSQSEENEIDPYFEVKDEKPVAPQTYEQLIQTNNEILCTTDKEASEPKERNNIETLDVEEQNHEDDCNRDHDIHADSSLTCAICNKNFRSAPSFKMHLKRHTLGSRFNCLDCGKSYYSNSELARHSKLHTGYRGHPCHLCGMSFFSKPELNRHSKYHKGEKRFECKICFKTYYESGHLKVHERLHTGEKPFACKICDKAFTTKSKLMRHFKIHGRDEAT